MITFWLAYIVITMCLLYILYNINKQYRWCQHNFKAIKEVLKGQLLLNDLNRNLIQEVDEKVDAIIKKGGKHVKKK